MIIYIAGINHYGPFCREQLRYWLTYLSDSKPGNRPCFVAIEWDQDLHKAVVAQRNGFRQKLMELWPQLPPTSIEKLVQSIGYEADTHSGVFPETRIVWLDDGRKDPEIHDYADSRIAFYLNCINFSGQSLADDDPEFVEKLAGFIKANAPPPRKSGDQRDDKFARSIRENLGDCSSDWAVVIVGFEHAREVDGSMYQLLTSAGHQCEVEFFWV